MTVSSAIPSGSVTKPFTAMRVYQLATAGKFGALGIDTPLHQVVDPWLARQTPPQPTLLELWKGDKVIQEVTLRQIMGMSAGFQDYSDPDLECVVVYISLAWCIGGSRAGHVYMPVVLDSSSICMCRLLDCRHAWPLSVC